MRTQFSKFALTATIALAITFTFNACEEKGGGGGKLLEAITDEFATFKFEYDKQNRIVKMNDEAITYADNSVTVGNRKIVINGNTVTYDGGTYTIDKDGYVVNDGQEYEYKDGNLIRYWTNEYSYDNKKSPFSGCTSPKWLIQYLFKSYARYWTYASKNNVVSSGGDGASSTYKYEYDSDGFPVKLTTTWEGEEGEGTTTTRFTYRGEPPTATAKTETTAPQAAAKPAETAGGFKSVKIGEQVWMAENLNIEIEGSKCYDNKPDNCKKYGRLYNWETAKKACPSGWHLPSYEEWQTLVDLAGGYEVAGKALKAKNGWNNNGNGTDNFSFSALPGGEDGFNCEDDYGGCVSGNFNSVGEEGKWWSATKDDFPEAEVAYVFTISEKSAYSNPAATGYLLSVRCIQN